MSLKSCLSTIHARPSAINVAYGEVKLTLESLIPKKPLACQPNLSSCQVSINFSMHAIGNNY